MKKWKRIGISSPNEAWVTVTFQLQGLAYENQ